MKGIYKIILSLLFVVVISGIITYGVLKFRIINSHKILNGKIHKILKLHEGIDVRKNKIDYPIYYINLDRSTDRKRKMEKQFNKYGVENTTRISAVDGKKLYSMKEGFVTGLGSYSNFFSMTPRQLGCTLSHIKAIKQAYESGLETVLVLEDDVSLDLMPLWSVEKLSDLVKTFPDWEIVKFGNVLCPNKAMVNIEYYACGKNCWSSSSYLINRRGMKSIIDSFFQNDHIILDTKLSKDQGHADQILFANAKTLVYHPLMFFGLPIKSTINSLYEASMLYDTSKNIDKYLDNL